MLSLAEVLSQVRSMIPAHIAAELSNADDFAGTDNAADKNFWPNQLVKSAFQSLSRMYAGDDTAISRIPPGLALAAIFDLVVNAVYASSVTDSGWVYCLGIEGKQEPVHYYAFVAACPRCTMQGKPIYAQPHKPKSDTIGRATSTTLALIFRHVMATLNSSYVVARPTSSSGDVDMYICGIDLVALAEIKASPLISYPLAVLLAQPMTDEDAQTHEQRLLPNHEEVHRVVSEAKTILLYLPHYSVSGTSDGMYIDLGPKDNSAWPFPALVSWVGQPENLSHLILAWLELLNSYTSSLRLRRQRPAAFFLTHGCGSPISDSKNAPGLDRTDDLKKGTYQVLKYGAYYGMESDERVVKAMLVGNIHSIAHYAGYMEKLEDVVWTKSYLLYPISEQEVGAKKRDIFWLYDAVICFTQTMGNNETLKKLFD